MMNEEYVKKWNRKDRYLFRITMFFFGFGLLLFILTLSLLTAVSEDERIFLYSAMTGLYISIATFVYGFFRIIKYLPRNRQYEGLKVVRTIISTLLSPVNIGIFFATIFLIGIAGCEIQ